MLVVMKGPPGTGKSTVARALSHQLGWPLIAKDDIKDILDGQATLSGALSYEVMHRIAHRQISQGLSVICDSPLPEKAYAGMRRIAHDEGVPLVIVECRCSDEKVWRARVEARQAWNLPAHHTITWEGVESFLAKPETTYLVDDPCLVVDTTRALPEIVDEIVVWLTRPDLAPANS